MVENRTVLKAFGSMGPAGSLASLCEKFCRIMFRDAYEQGDPSKLHAKQFEEKVQEQRKNYVTDMFAARGGLERSLTSLKPETQDKGNENLAILVSKHVAIVAQTEKSRILRERMFYRDEPKLYAQCLARSKQVESLVIDNLVKMAVHIIEGANIEFLMERVKVIIADGNTDVNDAENLPVAINERISL